MPRLKIMKNYQNELLSKNKTTNKKSKKSKVLKKKKEILKSEEIVFENRIEDTLPFANEELDSGLNKETADEEEIKNEAIEEINDEASEEINEEISDEAGDKVSDEIAQETKFKKLKKNTSLYELLSRPFGATMEELEKELNWKKASIRGTISNLQKEQEFCLMTINIIKPNLDDMTFYKETRYFIKDCEFSLFDDLLNNLPNQSTNND